MPNNRQIRLAITQLQYHLLRIPPCKRRILPIHTLPPPGGNQLPCPANIRPPLNSQDRLVNRTPVRLDVLVVRAVQRCREEVVVDAPFWGCKEVCEDRGLVAEVMVEDVGGAARRVAGDRDTVEAGGAGVGDFEEEGGSAAAVVAAAAGGGECAKDAVVGEEGFDGARVKVPCLLDGVEDVLGEGEDKSAGSEAGEG